MTIGNVSIPEDVYLLNVLLGLAGLFWTIAYVLIIYRGFKDKTYGMPMLVLCLNIVWEFMYGFMGDPIVPVGSALEISRQPLLLRLDDVLCFLFDCCILYLLFKYGRKEFEKFHPYAPKGAFVPTVLLFLLLSFLFITVSVYEWNDHNGIYIAYVDEVIMATLFIRMLWRRGNADGQSMWIGLFKFVGTIFTILAGGLVVRREWGVTRRVFCEMEFLPLMKLCIILILVLDIAYLVFLYRTMKYKQHLNPWTRKPLASD